MINEINKRSKLGIHLWLRMQIELSADQIHFTHRPGQTLTTLPHSQDTNQDCQLAPRPQSKAAKSTSSCTWACLLGHVPCSYQTQTLLSPTEGREAFCLSPVCNMNPTFHTTLLSFSMSPTQHEDDLENIPSNRKQSISVSPVHT